MLRSYNNADDAMRDGAYVMAFAAVEDLEGLVTIARADTKTGADYSTALSMPNQDRRRSPLGSLNGIPPSCAVRPGA